MRHAVRLHGRDGGSSRAPLTDADAEFQSRRGNNDVSTDTRSNILGANANNNNIIIIIITTATATATAGTDPVHGRLASPSDPNSNNNNNNNKNRHITLHSAIHTTTRPVSHRKPRPEHPDTDNSNNVHGPAQPTTARLLAALGIRQHPLGPYDRRHDDS